MTSKQRDGVELVGSMAFIHKLVVFNGQWVWVD
jgi:hypothetical protein